VYERGALTCSEGQVWGDKLGKKCKSQPDGGGGAERVAGEIIRNVGELAMRWGKHRALGQGFCKKDLGGGGLE